MHVYVPFWVGICTKRTVVMVGQVLGKSHCLHLVFL